MKQSKIIGLTGSIATGKSQVTKILKEMSYKVIDSDLIARDVMDDREVIEKIKKYFGENLYRDNKLDRQALGKIIFNSLEKKELLDSITHPLIYKKILEEINMNKDENLLFIDIPLLIENGINSYEMNFYEVWLVYSDKKTQIKRLMERDNIDESYAKAKISSQMSIEDKKDYADIIIDNRGNLKDLKNQVIARLKYLESL